MTNISSAKNFGHDVQVLKTEHKQRISIEKVDAEKTKKTPLGQTISENTPGKAKKAEQETTVNSVKQQFNSSILKATLNVSVSAGDEPMALLLRTAIEGINEALEESGLEVDSIQKAYDSGLDVSPEATAERIVSLSTAFFGSYKEQHPELSDQEAATKFTEIISGGIDTGFSEAKEILDGLSVLEGDIASNIDATYDLVQQGLKAFVDDYVERDEEKSIEEPSKQ